MRLALLHVMMLLAAASAAGSRPVLATFEARNPHYEARRGLVLRIAECVVFADYACVGAMRSTLCAAPTR